MPLSRWFLSRRRLGKSLPAAPSAPRGVRVYAIGDIHGRLDLLRRLAAQIQADMRSDPPDFALEIFLGDYVDRGPKSKQVLDYLISVPSVCHRRVCLRGNHEEMLLLALADPAGMAEWLDYGGKETLLSYGVPPLLISTRQQLMKAQLALSAAFPRQHQDFLESLPLKTEVGDYLFVHAGIDPQRPLASQRSEDLLWIREPFLSANTMFERFIVHGHTPTEAPDIRRNRANIDTGAYITGILTCLVLEHDSRRIIQATSTEAHPSS